jgi:hypothetical protein
MGALKTRSGHSKTEIALVSSVFVVDETNTVIVDTAMKILVAILIE